MFKRLLEWGKGARQQPGQNHVDTWAYGWLPSQWDAYMVLDVALSALLSFLLAWLLAGLLL